MDRKDWRPPNFLIAPIDRRTPTRYTTRSLKIMQKPRCFLIAIVLALQLTGSFRALGQSNATPTATGSGQSTSALAAEGYDVTKTNLFSPTLAIPPLVSSQVFVPRPLGLRAPMAPAQPAPGLMARTRRETVALLTQADGAKFTGGAYGGVPNGWGVYTATNGTRLTGEWRMGQAYAATGRLVVPDGTIEDGTWLYYLGRGNGTIIWKAGIVYRGDWKINQGDLPELPDGEGTMTWPDGHKYAGHFVNGALDGYGIMTLPDGKTMRTHWVDGKPMQRSR
jgi:hypothetical protein